MAKATLEFDFLEERDVFETAINGAKYLSALEALREAFRSKAKYAEPEETTWEHAKELFWETLRAEGIDL